MEKLAIPSWFLTLLDETRPSLAALADRLEALTRQKLVAYASTYRDVAEHIIEVWNNPIVDGAELSEDDIEDICDWVVSQGDALITRAYAERADLKSIVKAYRANEKGTSKEFPKWDTVVKHVGYQGFQSPRGIAIAVYERVHHADLFDELDEES